MTNGYAQYPQSGGMADRTALGLVVDGSLSQGIEVRLDQATSIEDIKVGAFVTIQGQHGTFFGTVTDVTLGSTDPRLKHTPPQVDDALVLQVVSGTVAYGAISVLPNLVLPTVLGDDEQGPSAAKTIPPHFAPTYLASQRDVELVFGQEDQRHFWIGSPLDMEHKLCLNLDELVKRSIGVFGKSGTGKTFLTRLLLVGILQQRQASSLIFDMHSEYGWSGQDADRSRMVKGLKQLFPAQVSTFTLDEESSRRRGSSTDAVVRIGYEDIEPEDVEMLRETLNLSDVAASAAFNLQQKFGQKEWMRRFLNLEGRDSVFDLAAEVQVQPHALGRALQSTHPAQTVRVPGGPCGKRRGEQHHRALGPGPARGAGIRQVRLGPDRLHAGLQPADPAHPQPVRATEGGSRGRRRPGT